MAGECVVKVEQMGVYDGYMDALGEFGAPMWETVWLNEGDEFEGVVGEVRQDL